MNEQLLKNSSLWVEKYRPSRLKDVILPDRIQNFFEQIIASKEVPNLLFAGSAGRGKTTIALALCNEIEADKLFLNASLNNSVDEVRYNIQQFSMTSSITDDKKIVVLDEACRLTNPAQDSIKALVEMVEANCRFIFTTNNLAKIIDPIKSRCQIVDFSFTKNDIKDLVIKAYKRCCYILENENVTYDKKILAEFVQKRYPDLRKVINDLQKYYQTYGSIDEKILQFNDQENAVANLVDVIKEKKFNEARKMVSAIDPATFYKSFYDEIDSFLKDESKPDVIITLSQYAYQHGLSVDTEINLMGCIIEIMKSAKWR